MKKLPGHIIAILFLLFAVSCGGGSSGGGNTNQDTSSDCIVGTSKIGGCNIK